ncbi:MAG: InlB B-repeat-containing protein [Alloprevotella sp.]
MLKRLLLLLIFLYPGFLLAQTDDAPRDTTLRVLCIGNSFSLDGSTLLPQLLVDAGVSTRKFQIYAAVYAGASLEYWDNMRASDAPLPYIYNMGGSLFKLENKQWTLRTLLQNQPWDVVVIQQASPQSNKPNSYQPYISRLNEYIHQECLNKQVRVAWQLTWSYPETATSGPIDEEGWREIAMIANQKCHDAGISTIIPSGTAIQNARTTSLGQDSNALTRDGLHLTLGVGRYIAAMSWYESICRPIFGKSIIGTPVSKVIKDCDRGKEGFQEVTDENYSICQQCVLEAVSDPLHLMTDPVDERPVFYEVSFEANGQTTIQYLPKDSLIPEPAIPAAPTGYHFAGWNPAYDTTSTVPQWGIHYQIVWKPNDYSFSFDSNGGTAVDTLTQTYDNAFVPPADPSRTGYTFLGWQPALPDSVPAADMTFTAQWQVNTYTLAFDANGGTPVDTIVQNYDTALVPPADPSRTGYTFLGWEPALPDSIPPYDITYTAQWQVNTYTLAFDANGGTPVDTIVQNYDTALVPPADPSRTGYTFLGWEPALPDSIPPYDITYTAQWQVNSYALSFDSDGGTPVDTIVQNYDTALVPPADPVLTGHLFAGWMPALPDSIPPHDAHYVAMWQRCDYILQFDTDGGSALSPLRSPYGAALVPPSPPQREGFNFLGWEPQIPTYMPAYDLTCKARWERAEFTLTFDSNQGSSVTAISQLYDTPITPPESPVRHGYIFCGWQPPLPERMPAASITHHAVWEAQQFLVRYFVGDSLVHQDSVAFEAPIPPFTPTLSETYVWKGWQEALPYWMPCHPLDFHAVLVHRLLYRFGGRADVYSPQGCLILRQADTEAIRRLTPGPYIIGSMKVWLK